MIATPKKKRKSAAAVALGRLSRRRGVSKAQREASRRNGAKGGRPPKSNPK